MINQVSTAALHCQKASTANSANVYVCAAKREAVQQARLLLASCSRLLQAAPIRTFAYNSNVARLPVYVLLCCHAGCKQCGEQAAAGLMQPSPASSSLQGSLLDATDLRSCLFVCVFLCRQTGCKQCDEQAAAGLVQLLPASTTHQYPLFTTVVLLACLSGCVPLRCQAGCKQCGEQAAAGLMQLCPASSTHQGPQLSYNQQQQQ
jgi:hypothetical protein